MSGVPEQMSLNRREVWKRAKQKLMNKSHVAVPTHSMTPPEMRHREKRRAWMMDTIVGKSGLVRVFAVIYCPDCLQGYVAGFSYDKPEGKSIKDLGVTIAREWSLACPARKVEGKL